VDDGAFLRVRGAGEAVKGGEAGDLFLRLHVRADPRFTREGDTIISKKDIGFSQAALGATVTADTVDGPVELKIPAGIQSGEKLRLKGKGVPRRGSRGDQIVVINVVTPRKLSREQKRLLDDLDLRQ
jgi:molecular chaperone DnaJ